MNWLGWCPKAIATSPWNEHLKFSAAQDRNSGKRYSKLFLNQLAKFLQLCTLALCQTEEDGVLWLAREKWQAHGGGNWRGKRRIQINLTVITACVAAGKSHFCKAVVGTHTPRRPHLLGAKGSLGRICMGEFGLPEQKKPRPNPDLRRRQMTGPPDELALSGSRRAAGGSCTRRKSPAFPERVRGRGNTPPPPANPAAVSSGTAPGGGGGWAVGNGSRLSRPPARS